jgi:hypothetical protein
MTPRFPSLFLTFMKNFRSIFKGFPRKPSATTSSSPGLRGISGALQT